MKTRTWTRLARALAAAGLTAALSLPAAAAPGSFAYVGELTDAMGFVDDEVDVTVKLFDAATDGNELWSQAWNGVDVVGGLFMVNVGMGAGSPIGPVLLDRSDVWLELSVDGATLAPRQKLNATGYAQVARHARKLGGVAAADYLTQTALDATPSRAGTASMPPANPAPGELWYDEEEQILYTWDAADMEWEAVTTGDLAPSNLPPNGMKAVSNGSLTNEFTNISHLWAPLGGAPIEDATIAGPGQPALAEVAVVEAPASYIYGVQVFTNFNLTSANNITMTLFPPAGTGGAPIVLRNGPLAFGTYSDVWNLTNTPALEALLMTNPSGPWTIAVVDNDNNLAAPTTAGTLNSFELRYDIVRGDNLQGAGLFEVDDVVAGEIEVLGASTVPEAQIDGSLRTTGSIARRMQVKTFRVQWGASTGNINQRNLTFTKRRDDTALLITLSDTYRENNTTTFTVDFNINGNPCRRADNNLVRFYFWTNTGNYYNDRFTSWHAFCERAQNVGDGTFIPAGTYDFQVSVNVSSVWGYNSSIGAISVEEVFVD